ncbi:MAG: tetratricopeptide repeat protein [Spirochaetales bacterium]|nr:tetratricopeptide repeat protein [Spirochaetales bacterium]
MGLLGQGNFAQARSSFDQAIALDAQSARAYAYKAESYFQENPENASALQQAVENANRAVQYDQNLWVPHNTLGKIYAQQRNWDQAITEFREAARLNPQDADVLFEMGKAQYRAGAFDAARQTFESSIYLNSGNSRALYNLGITYLRLANPPTRAHLNSALSAQQRAVAVDPAYAEAQFALGDVLSRLNRDGEALTAYRQAATLSPDNITYHIALGTCSYRLNRYGDAEASFRRALQIQGDHPTANYNLALTLDQEGKSAEALPFALQAVQAVPNDATYGYTLGKVYQNLGNTGEAIAAYERAASLRRDYLLPRINLGDLYDQQGEYAKALEHLLTAYRIDPNSVEVNTNLGNTYFHSRIYDRAITHYEQALSRNPNDALMRYHLALACIEAGQDAKAQGLLTELIALAPDYWDAYYRLGNLLYKGGETQQASDIFRNLLNRNPNYPARAEIEPLILP